MADDLSCSYIKGLPTENALFFGSLHLSHALLKGHDLFKNYHLKHHSVYCSILKVLISLLLSIFFYYKSFLFPLTSFPLSLIIKQNGSVISLI